MKKWEMRRDELLSELKIKGKLTIEQITALLEISDSTARRLIIELEKDGYLIRCFGGVQALLSHGKEYSYEETKDVNFESKKLIADTASGLVENGDVIFLSGGSTLKQMSLSLLSRIERGELTQLSVVTNSLVAAEILQEKIDVIMPGGIYRSKLEVLNGSLTEKNLRSMCFHKAFMGTVSLNREEGFMTSDIETNCIHETVIQRSSAFYVLADFTKFNTHSLISYSPLSEAAGIITDNAVTDAIRIEYEKAGITLITPTNCL